MKKTRMYFIGAWTCGTMELMSEVREEIEKEFHRQTEIKEDWLYEVSVNGAMYFVVENGEFGFTAMLPSEY